MRWLRAAGLALALGFAPWGAQVAQANCSERCIPLEEVDALQAQAIAKHQAGPEGAWLAGYREGFVTTTEAFAALPPAQRRALFRGWAFAYREAMSPEARRAEEENNYMGSPIELRDHLGRFSYALSACHGEFTSLTEHQRYQQGFALWTIAERKNTHPLPAGIRMASVKQRFHRVMSWKPEYFIAWVPEGGFFEINLEREAELAKLRAFWPVAPRGVRYEVLLNDGRRIASVTRE